MKATIWIEKIKLRPQKGMRALPFRGRTFCVHVHQWGATNSSRMLSFVCRFERVVDNSIHHVTSTSSRDSILSNQLLRASKLTSSPYVGILSLNKDAPPCSYFSVTPASHGCIPLVTSVSPRHEPGEVCSSLVVNLNSLTHNDDSSRMSSPPKAFFMGASLTENSPSYRQNLRVVVLLTKDPHVQRWASENSIELDLRHNPLLQYVSTESTSGEPSNAPGIYEDVLQDRWFVATKCKLDAEKGTWRPLQVVVALSGDTNIKDLADGYRWQTVYHIEEVLRYL